MKRILFTSLLIISILACENEGTLPLDIEDFSIQRITKDQVDATTVIDFSYDTNGNLISVSERNAMNDGSETWNESIQFSYSNNRVIDKSYRYLSEDRDYRRDSITYTSNGYLDKVYTSSPYTGTWEVQSVSQYAYNSDGTLKSLSWVNPSSLDTEFSYHYSWSKGNVSKTTTYNGDQIFYEVFFEYDNSINYKLGNPFFEGFEQVQTRNNITKATYQDHSGLLDLACNPCQYAYEYNEFNLPVKVIPPYARSSRIEYEVQGDQTN